MSVEVKNLTATVQAAKLAIAKAGKSAARLNASAQNLTGVLATVDAMSDQLDDATAELQGATAVLTNGGPPLDDTGSGGLVQGHPTPAEGVRASIIQVDAANK